MGGILFVPFWAVLCKAGWPTLAPFWSGARSLPAASPIQFIVIEIAVSIDRESLDNVRTVR